MVCLRSGAECELLWTGSSGEVRVAQTATTGVRWTQGERASPIEALERKRPLMQASSLRSERQGDMLTAAITQADISGNCARRIVYTESMSDAITNNPTMSGSC